MNLYLQKETEFCAVGFFQECTYNLAQINSSGKQIAALIENEITINGISPENIFLAGFGQGGQIVYNVAFGQLTYTIGGYFSIASYPMYPAFQSISRYESRRRRFTHYSEEMSWFMFSGELDVTYPAEIGRTEYLNVFEDLEI